MSRYTSTTDDDLRAMLAAIGVGSLDELFAEIPEGVRLEGGLDLPAERADVGTAIEIDVRGKTREAVVAERPLYRKERDG